MVDIDLFVHELQKYGHTVGTVVSVPENAGGYELFVDGTLIPIEDARRILEEDEIRATR
jgi:hypothetical protein